MGFQITSGQLIDSKFQLFNLTVASPLSKIVGQRSRGGFRSPGGGRVGRSGTDSPPRRSVGGIRKERSGRSREDCPQEGPAVAHIQEERNRSSGSGLAVFGNSALGDSSASGEGVRRQARPRWSAGALGGNETWSKSRRTKNEQENEREMRRTKPNTIGRYQTGDKELTSIHQYLTMQNDPNSTGSRPEDPRARDRQGGDPNQVGALAIGRPPHPEAGAAENGGVGKRNNQSVKLSMGSWPVMEQDRTIVTTKM